MPSTPVLETESSYAFRDINPAAPVHVLVVPKRHVASVTDLGPDDGPMLADLYSAINQVARKEGVAERGFRVVSNAGPDAGQVVFHLHFHVLGGRNLRWPPPAPHGSVRQAGE